MDETDENKLMKEYANKFEKFIYRPLKLTGFCRFDIVDKQIVQLTKKSMIYNTVLIIVADFCVGYLLFSSLSLGTYLQIPDALCVSHFAWLSNFIILNFTFLNRRSGLDFVEHCIKIDSYLGIRETTFIRDIAGWTFFAIYCIVLTLNISIGIFLCEVYTVPVYINIIGTTYICWLCFAYNDYGFSAMLFTLNALRIRYLNVALLKVGDINENYIPSQSVFYLLFWNKKFNNLVTFQQRAGVEEFNRAFRMCYDMIHLLERYYSFPYLYGVCTVVMGTFVAVQTFIMRVKNPTAMGNEQTYVIFGVVALSWLFLVLMSTITDMSAHQIQQTKLICSYIQMKPNKSAKIYKLTKTVLGTIRMRDAVPRVYNIFHFNFGFSLRIAASTLVYITVQLQMAFPAIPLNSGRFNETSE